MAIFFVVGTMLLNTVCGAGPRELPLKPPRHGGVYVVAHRGAHRGIPENTLAAYKKAIELGVDFVEIDVQTTRDGRFVSIHNRTVDDYCIDGTKGKVSDFTLAELKTMDINSRIGPEWKNERIPTLEEILDLCKGKCGIYLDLKNAPVEPLVKLIKERGMEHDVVWYAGVETQKQIKKLCPECIEMPDPGPEENLPALIEILQPRVIAAVWRYYSRSFVEKCHAANAIVIVDEGDVADESDTRCWDQALAWATDGIQTDWPAELITFLRTRQQSSREK